MANVDLRVVKTGENIINSYLDLLKIKSNEKITIKELCEKARISRNTFYRHFQYKDNLYDTVIDESVNSIVSEFKPLIYKFEELNDDIIFQYISNFIEAFYKEKDTLNTILLQDKGLLSSRLLKSFQESIIYTSSLISENAQSKEYQLYINYISAGLLGFVLEWIKDDYPIDKAKEILFNLNYEPMKGANDLLK